MRRLFQHAASSVPDLSCSRSGLWRLIPIARYFLTPPSFGEYGWYRGAALAELATRDRVYAGKKACEECHSDEYQKLMKHEHKGLACECCHGPGEAHAGDPRKDNIDRSSYAACLRCHEANPVAAEVAQTDREQEPLHRIQVHGMPRAAQPVGGPMKNNVSRRSVLGRITAAVAGLLAAPAAKAAKAVMQKVAGFRQRAEGL